jgi:hypothetical protein
MSKFVKSSTALGTPDPINLDEMFSFQKFDAVSLREEKGRHQILFLRGNNQNTGARDVYWKYKCKCDRDAEYDKLLEMNVATL